MPDNPGPGVEEQLGDDIVGGYNVTWISYNWNSATQSYYRMQATDPLAVGKGNWTYSITGSSSTMVIDGSNTPVVDCTTWGMPGNCFAIDLVVPANGSTALNMIGNPFTTIVPWADVRIAALTGVNTWTAYTPTNAEANGYVLKSVQRYNNGYQPFEDGGSNPGQLEIQESVWVRSMDPSGHSTPASALKLLIADPCAAEVVSAGQTWLACNLGASQVATSSADALAYGDLYQWGRLTDGHEKRTSGTTATLSNTDVPGHNLFITAPNLPYDWRNGRNDFLWQGVSGTNNPCPAGFRLPTYAELFNEQQSWSTLDSAGAYASPLKLVAAGLRGFNAGLLYNAGSNGLYWCSTVSADRSRRLLFDSTSSFLDGSHPRAYGFSVRCIKD